jgi:ADP-ribosylglycohydrolase
MADRAVHSVTYGVFVCRGKSTCFRDGCLFAVNLGDDADTTGAVYGQLAGAYYGESNMPESWLAGLSLRDEIGRLAERLAASRKSALVTG